MTTNRDTTVTVIGAGLAGCEAAWQLARRGIGVRLHERKPRSFSPAHRSEGLAELVCSNSLGALAVEGASGLLKEELRRQDSLIIAAAEKARVPAGAALAVDRDVFSAFITESIEGHPLIELTRDEALEIPSDGPVVIATGPLTADALADAIRRRTGGAYLYFHDAISPVIEADSIDTTIAYRKSRYDKGGDDYLNCPLTREEYDAFVDAVAAGEKVELKDFETLVPFEGCQPIEVMVERGRETLAFGPMKPVGLEDPRTGRRPHAVVQLRQENRHGTLWNMVGFQTKLKWPEQKRIFRMIPGLQNAEFARLGSLHRNTFLNTPVLLDKALRLRSEPRIRFAGQIVGVEGYVDSTAMGCYVARSLAAELEGREAPPPPPTTMTGALLAYVTEADPKHFQPMNANFGLLPPLEGRKMRKADRKVAYAKRALEDFGPWSEAVG